MKKNSKANGYFNFVKDHVLSFIQKHPFMTLAVACIFFWGLENISQSFFLENATVMFLIELSVIICFGVFLKIKGNLSTRNIIIILALTSFLMHVMYIYYTGYGSADRQHDVGSLGWEGHIGYIEHFVRNNFQLPDFNPLAKWQFYHPPLHHLIAALWVKVNVFFSNNYLQAYESIQILTLFYSGCITIISYKILREFNLKKAALAISFAIICFHPTLTILSGSVNNDILCFALMMAAVLWTIRWYKNPGFLSVIMIALFLGLSMLAKTSGFILAPGIAVIFLIKLLQKSNGKFGFELKGKLRLVFQYLTFGLISIPIGLSWNIYESLRFNVPINHIPRISSAVEFFIWDNSFYHRFLDFSAVQFQNVFESFHPPFTHNIIIAILKNSVFGEFNPGNTHNDLTPIANFLFYINAFLIVVAVVCMVWVLIKKTVGADFGLKFFIFALNVGILAFYVSFCLDYTVIPSMDYRYIAPTFILGSIFIGIALNTLQESDSRSARFIVKGTGTITALFCIASICAASFLFMFMGPPI